MIVIIYLNCIFIVCTVSAKL